MFTPDVHSRHAYFITHRRAIHFVSLDSWLDPITTELDSPGPKGSEFRLSVLLQDPEILRERILQFQKRLDDSQSRPLSAPGILQDSDLGYFLLTAFPDEPYAAVFDHPSILSAEPPPHLLALTEGPSSSDFLATDHGSLDPRPAYQPAPALFEPIAPQSALAAVIQQSAHGARLSTSTLNRTELRLSSDTLNKLTALHRHLSATTQNLGQAVAELFTRGHRLPIEFAGQRRRVRDVAERVDGLRGEDADDYGSDDDEQSSQDNDAEKDPEDDENEQEDDENGQEDDGNDRGSTGGEETPVRRSIEARGPARIEERLKRVDAKQSELGRRYEELRRKLSTVSAKPLSQAEQAWTEEVQRLADSVEEPEDDDGGDGSETENADGETVTETTPEEEDEEKKKADVVSRQPGTKAYWERYDEVCASRSSLARALSRTICTDIFGTRLCRSRKSFASKLKQQRLRHPTRDLPPPPPSRTRGPSLPLPGTSVVAPTPRVSESRPRCGNGAWARSWICCSRRPSWWIWRRIDWKG